MTGLKKILVVAIVAVTSGAMMFVASPPSQAVGSSGWNAGYIISDANFYDGAAMTDNDIQNFLQSKGASCSAGQLPCLKDFVMATPATPTEQNLCNAMPVQPIQNAAQIIGNVARACGISPMVMLTTLQKESALVTKTKPTVTNYQAATGFGCPDTAACDSQYYGFFNQVYRMARQFKVYTANPTRYGYIAGRSSSILYNPSRSCGSSSVYIQNQATANLYIYTPYQPNAAALASLYGTGDGCSAYGNRNFWRIYSDWFGSPTGGGLPKGSFDTLVADTKGNVNLSGWAFDPTAQTANVNVAVYRDGVGLAWYSANTSRADVNAAYSVTGNHGFSISIGNQPPGSHQYCVYAIDIEGNGNPSLGCRTATITGVTPPIGNFESTADSNQTVTLTGWMLDPDSPNSSGTVHVYRNGQVLAAFGTNVYRSDVNSAYKVSGNHGFSVTLNNEPVGNNSYCIYAIDNEAITANPSIGCRSAQVTPTPATPPISNYEALSAKYQNVLITGWSFDPDSPSAISQVALYRDGIGVGWFATNANRPDVNSAFGISGIHGLSLSLTNQPVGEHSYCLYAIDSQGVAGNPALGCRTIAVTATPLAAPKGSFDEVSAANGSVTIRGWSFDPDSPSVSNQVAVYRNGVGLAQYSANVARPDVDSAFSISGNHGFQFALAAEPSGSNTYCIYAIDIPGTVPNPLLGCRTITVP